MQPSPAHETLDHRAGIPTTLFGDGSELDPGRSARRAALNRERQRKIIDWVEEYADSRRSSNVGGRLPTAGEVAREVGLDLLPPATDSHPASYADRAAAAMKAYAVPANTGLGDLRLFAWDQRHWFLTDLHPGNVFTWQGKPTVIDALIGEAPPALLTDFPELLIAAQGPHPRETRDVVQAPAPSQPSLF